MKADDSSSAQTGTRTGAGMPLVAGTPQAEAAMSLLGVAPVFQSFHAADLAALIERSHDLKFIDHADGTDIVREGEPASRLLVLRSGSAEPNQWIAQEINFYDDYRTFFGSEPGKVQGIAIISSSDSTQSSASADFDDFVLLP